MEKPIIARIESSTLTIIMKFITRKSTAKSRPDWNVILKLNFVSLALAKAKHFWLLRLQYHDHEGIGCAVLEA